MCVSILSCLVFSNQTYFLVSALYGYLNTTPCRYVCVCVQGWLVSPCILNSVVGDGDEWLTLCPGNSTSRRKKFSSHRTGGRLDPRTGFNVAEKRIIPVLARNVTLFPCFPPHNLVTTLTEETLFFPQDIISIDSVYSSWQHVSHIIYLLTVKVTVNLFLCITPWRYIRAAAVQNKHP